MTTNARDEAGAGSGVDVDVILENRIFRKACFRLLPLLVIGLFVNIIDRANLGVIRVPMSSDLGLSASDFGIAAGVFYLGYLLFEVPSNIAMHRFGARMWISRIMISWGVVTVVVAFATGPASLQLTRFLLGVAEAGFYPGVILYLTYWFPKRLLARAYTVFNIAGPIALTTASILTSATLLMDGTLGLAGWRWTFLLQGTPAIILGIAVLVLLPRTPRAAKWLSDEEKDYIQRSTDQRGGGGSGDHSLRHVVRQRATWSHTLLYFCMTLSFWTITYWLPTLISQTFKAGVIRSGLISAIPWGFAAIVMIVLGITSSRLGDVRWHMVGCMVMGSIGLVISVAAQNPVVSLIGIALGAAGATGAMPIFWAHVSAVFSDAKAVVAIAFINAVANISGFAGPYLMGLVIDFTGNLKLGLAGMTVVFIGGALLAFRLTRKERIS